MVRSDGSAGHQSAAETAPSEGAVRAQLGQILGSADFAQSGRINAFLSFVVEETLAGRSDRLKEYTIATTVFERDESFDPQTNTIVRVEAGRLRRRLERYYLTEGRGDPVRIDLPKGTYVPLFREARPGADAVAEERRGTSAPGDAVLEMPSGPSIAVLPFDNLSGDPGQDFFGDGISEEIISDLTRFPNLRVISRHSSFKFKGEKRDIREIGRDLGVRYVLEGSVRKAGDMLRVTGQLIDAADGAHLFSETYDRDLSAQNILAIQDDIADRIVAAIGQPYGIIARAGARSARAKPAHHLDAYDAVLRFYEYWMNATPERHRAVRAALERAIEIDPGYSTAWAALAGLLLDEVRFDYSARNDDPRLDRALEVAQRAVMLDPEDSAAYHFLFSTHFHRGEIDEFRATGERAVSLNPNHADLLADYGLMLCCIGDWERGVALARKAIALSPVHPGWFHGALALFLYNDGDFAAALAEARQLRMPDVYWTHVFNAMCLGQLGREEEARAAGRTLLTIAPDFDDVAWEQLASWNMPDELCERIVDGLRKAGLVVPDRAG